MRRILGFTKRPMFGTTSSRFLLKNRGKGNRGNFCTTVEQRREMVRMYNEGASLAEISRAIGTSWDNVRNNLKRLGLYEHRLPQLSRP